MVIEFTFPKSNLKLNSLQLSAISLQQGYSSFGLLFIFDKGNAFAVSIPCKCVVKRN